MHHNNARRLLFILPRIYKLNQVDLTKLQHFLINSIFIVVSLKQKYLRKG